MPLACVDGCQYQCNTSKALDRHRKSCKFFAEYKKTATAARASASQARDNGLPTLLHQQPLRRRSRWAPMFTDTPQAREADVPMDVELEFRGPATGEGTTLEAEMDIDLPLDSDIPSNREADSPSPTVPAVELTRAGRPRRQYRIPKRFRDNLPDPVLVPVEPVQTPDPEPIPARRVILLMLGNLSKYFRARPSLGCLHHLAYIPSLPDTFHEFASNSHAKWKTQKQDILTHCRRELMHAVWGYLLDDDFIHAYKYGIVITCLDGIRRRVYPRFFTYSADYPEKVLLATIRDKGLCPCPRCMIKKTFLDRLGLRRDISIRINEFRTYFMTLVKKARNLIYSEGKSITGSQVQELLKEKSAVPTINAFVDRLGPDFNPSTMLAVDLLHEFELGVWRTLFTHLIRILHAASDADELVIELDKRYRQISTFSRDTIRKFSENSSEMKKLAARDFEDLLQCAIPSFEGLLDEPHNRRLMKLLYHTAEWHALAKLRMHTDTSLDLLESLTTQFGKLMREFRDLTCVAFETVELPREAAARAQRNAKEQDRGVSRQEHRASELSNTVVNGTGPINVVPAVSAAASDLQNTSPATTTADDNGVPAVNTSPNPEVALPTKAPQLRNAPNTGDYVRHIRLFGTTDSYSTQLGELAHRLIKALYGLTNKKNAMKQIGNKYNRQRALNSTERREEEEAGLHGRLEDHHTISKSRNERVNVYSFVDPDDPAKKDFIPKLKDHFLGRIQGRTFDGDTHDEFSREDRNTIRIINNTMFRLKTIRVNYTTYDLRRDYDTINPRVHPYIMCKSPETTENAHPYWYAAVLGIFRAEIQHVGKNSSNRRTQTVEFLWVRWLGDIQGHKAGRKYGRLPKVTFLPDSHPDAFGFLDPALVIRGCHLMPVFTEGRTTELLRTEGATECRPNGELDDWSSFYVGM
ncbi:hypothetical protein CPC08DRAFT_768761 [Agrocybe pediades]|nr:hypothetical protein CPC08DRAFT_768761 [Agrocybe pediades]